MSGAIEWDVVGVDLSLKCNGFADLWGTYAVKTLPRVMREGGAARLDWLTSQLARRMVRRPDLAVIEDYAYGTSNNGTAAIHEWGGVARLWLHRHGIPYVLVSPTTLKMYATGKGNAPKDDVFAAALRRCPDIQNNDAADAWWLWQMAAAHYDLTGAIPMPEQHRRALEKVEWPDLMKRGATCSQ